MQIGQSSFGGGSLNKTISLHSSLCCLRWATWHSCPLLHQNIANEKSVTMKSIKARHHLGALEQKAKNFERTFMHYSIAAKAEHKESLD